MLLFRLLFKLDFRESVFSVLFNALSSSNFSSLDKASFEFLPDALCFKFFAFWLLFESLIGFILKVFSGLKRILKGLSPLFMLLYSKTLIIAMYPNRIDNMNAK
eukprot:NODE_188_length_13518_cov_0.721142.p14 type:complete len:104 gc:universal NODE_188_length_13518_cov_0.721142:6699-7010(+)